VAARDPRFEPWHRTLRGRLGTAALALALFAGALLPLVASRVGASARGAGEASMFLAFGGLLVTSFLVGSLLRRTRARGRP
jgi:hypothetical protein